MDVAEFVVLLDGACVCVVADVYAADVFGGDCSLGWVACCDFFVDWELDWVDYVLVCLAVACVVEWALFVWDFVGLDFYPCGFFRFACD